MLYRGSTRIAVAVEEQHIVLRATRLMTDEQDKYNVSVTHICMMLACHNHNIQKHFTTPTI